MHNTNNSRQDDSGCISGLTVQVNVDRIDQVTDTLNSFRGVEVHIADPGGKLVVTIEENDGEKIMIDTMTRISQVDGVISTALVYTHHAA